MVISNSDGREPAPGSSRGAIGPSGGVDLLVALLALSLISAAVVMAVYYAPLLSHYGLPWWSQKIFFIHVPSGWGAMLSLGLVLVLSVAYLRTRSRKWDELAVACAEPGFLLCTVVLVTGPIWARPSWNTWWVLSDPKLVSFLAMWLVYGGYFVVRAYAGNRNDGRVAGAGIGILGAMSVPFVFISSKYWTSMHPPSPPLDPKIRLTLFVSLAGFTMLYLLLARIRFRLERARNDAEQARYRLAIMEE